MLCFYYRGYLRWDGSDMTDRYDGDLEIGMGEWVRGSETI